MVRLFAVVLAAVLSAPPAPAGDRVGDGICLRVPKGWSWTAEPLTYVTYPPQVLALASFRLPHGKSGANGCRPDAVFAQMPASGVFVYGWEYAQPSPFGPVEAREFPRRPTHFRLTILANYECMGESFMIPFREAKRFFQIHVVLGPRAGVASRPVVLRMLDSLRIAPR